MAVLHSPVLPEFLPVIAQTHDERSLPQPEPIERPEHPADRGIDVGNLAAVERTDRLLLAVVEPQLPATQAGDVWRAQGEGRIRG